VVPVDQGDSALKSRVWAKGLSQWRKGRFNQALQTFRKAERRLSRDIQRLFHPKTTEQAVENAKIQRWLQRYVYTERPSVIIRNHQFTFPALVWWAIADSACRTSSYNVANYALARVKDLRAGRDVDQHLAIVHLYRKRYKEADALAKTLPPDGFLTPYIEGWLAGSRDDLPRAKSRFNRARAAAALRSQRDALNRRINQYGLGQ